MRRISLLAKNRLAATW